jgi:hypothetical protein
VFWNAIWETSAQIIVHLGPVRASQYDYYFIVTTCRFHSSNDDVLIVTSCHCVSDYRILEYQAFSLTFFHHLHLQLESFSTSDNVDGAQTCYWPAEENTWYRYGNIEVMTTKQTPRLDYVLRVFEMRQFHQVGLTMCSSTS